MEPLFCVLCVKLVGAFLVCPIAVLIGSGVGGFLPALFNIIEHVSLASVASVAPVAVSDLLATLLATFGYQRAPAAQAAVLSLLDVFFSFSFEPLLGQAWDLLSVAGAALILL